MCALGASSSATFPNLYPTAQLSDDAEKYAQGVLQALEEQRDQSESNDITALLTALQSNAMALVPNVTSTNSADVPQIEGPDHRAEINRLVEEIQAKVKVYIDMRETELKDKKEAAFQLYGLQCSNDAFHRKQLEMDKKIVRLERNLTEVNESYKILYNSKSSEGTQLANCKLELQRTESRVGELYKFYTFACEKLNIKTNNVNFAIVSLSKSLTELNIFRSFLPDCTPQTGTKCLDETQAKNVLQSTITELTLAKTNLVVCNQELSTAKLQREEVDKTVVDLTNANASLKTEISNLNTRISELVQENKKYESGEKYDYLREIIKRLEEQHNSLSEKTKAKQLELDTINKNLEASQSVVQEAANQVSVTPAHLSESPSEVAELREANRQLEQLVELYKQNTTKIESFTDSDPKSKSPIAADRIVAIVCVVLLVTVCLMAYARERARNHTTTDTDAEEGRAADTGDNTGPRRETKTHGSAGSARPSESSP